MKKDQEKTLSYNEQIKSPHWQKRRLQILQRDNFTCQICGSTEKTLHVHHLCYRKDAKIWDYPDNTLITLCEDCHRMEHKMQSENDYSVTNLINDLLISGFTNFELVSILYKIAHESFVNNNQLIIDDLLNRKTTIMLDGNCDYDTLLFSDTNSVLKNLAERRASIKDSKS
jgi:Restriction endonuclease|nr:MAG TPA: NinG recombination protein [Caudoviricetes sp.]